MSDGVIGSIGVAVVPDAENFWRRFTDQTRAGADRAGRDLGAGVRRGIQAELDRGVDVRVRADTAAARAELDRLRAEIARANSNIRVGVKVDQQGQKQLNLLWTSIATLGPALIPIAGAALAAGAAFAGAGVAGILAFKGVQAEIKAGTALGNQFSGRLGVLKTDLAGIEHATVAATAGAFGRAEQKINAAVPQLSADIARLGAVSGDIVQHLVGGLVIGLHTFEPLMEHVLLYADRLAARFESWATGPGGAKFAATLSSDFDQVVPVLGTLVVTAGKLVAAFAPVGGNVLTEVGALAATLNALGSALDHITGGHGTQTLATAFVIWKTAGIVSVGVEKLTLSLRGLTAAEVAEGAASRSRLGGLAAGGLAKATPYIAAYAGLALGANSAAKATESWAGSQNHLQASLHATAVVAKDFLSLHWNKLPGDFSHGLDSSNAAIKAQGDINTNFTPAKLQVDIAQSQNAALQTELVLRRQIASVKQGPGSAVGAGPTLGNIQANAQALVAIKHNTDYYQQELNLVQGISRKYSNAIFTINAANDSALLHQLSKAPIDQAAGSFARLTAGLQTQIDAEKQWTDVGKKGSVTIDGQKYSVDAYNKALEQTGGDTTRAVGVLQGHTLALEADQYALKVAQLQQARLNTAVGEAEGKYRLTGAQVSTYAALVGITSDQVATGAVTAKQFSDSIGIVSVAVANGTTAVDGLVAAVAAFQGGADTAASRATLIGQTLIAANGDALAYAGTINQAAQANATLVASLAVATPATSAAAKATADATRATINLKTGAIDYSQVAAGPLLSALQGVQTAAMNAAAATYQHELATKGGKVAADDAYNTYVAQTQGQLIDEALKLGLTKDQAKLLADQYFGLANAPNIKKDIELEGEDKVATALAGILSDLDILAGKTVLPPLTLYTGPAEANLATFASHLDAVASRPGFIAANTSANGNIFEPFANGGFSKFANGAENHVAQIAPAGLRVWAEPETGGEAYIPLAQSKRARSLDILAQVASRFGYQPKPYTNGSTGTAKTAPTSKVDHWNIYEATDAAATAYEVKRRQWMAATV